MADSQMSEVVRHLRRAVRGENEAGFTDGQLLGRFLEQRDQAACAALVRRLGPLVWGVCRRILHQEHDAEDAFQATFLVLVRKAAVIRPRDRVAHWLYGVARQTALKARSTTAKRQAREKQVTTMPEPEPTRTAGVADLELRLDRELACLPDKYRAVIVLCDLGGKTRAEAACQLGVPEGTIAGRLARARALLARRLTRNGSAISSAALAALLAQSATAAAPAAVVSTTVHAATLVAAGQAAASVATAKAAALSEGVIKAMLLSKLKIVTTVLVLLALTALGGGLLARQTATEPPVQEQKAPLVIPQPAAGGAADAGQPVGKPADAPKKVTLKSAWAMKWLTAAGDRFILTLGGTDRIVLFVRDKKAAPAVAKHVYLISAEEAAGIVQALVDCGLWGRADTFPPGPFASGRDMTLGPNVPELGGPWWWHLGERDEDLSSMYIVQHLLKTLKGERLQAVKDWLQPVVIAKPPEPPVVPAPILKPQAGIGEAREIDIKGFQNPPLVFKGHVTKPTLIQSTADLVKAVPTKEWAAKIASQVDFTKEYLLLFAWAGPVNYQLSFEVKPGKNGPTVLFGYTSGGGKDPAPHYRLFALPANAAWGGFPDPTGGLPKATQALPLSVYKGTIKEVMPINKSVMILVEEVPKGQLGRVWFHPKENVPIAYTDNKPAGITDLKVGQHVTIEYKPTFYDSKPPQAAADRITIEAAPQELPALPLPPFPPQAGIGEARELNIKGFQNPPLVQQGQVSKPILIQSMADLVKAVPSKEWAAKISSQVDFTKEYLLLFAWIGAASDGLTFEVMPSKIGPTVQFTYTAGDGKDSMPHYRLFALPAEAAWGGLLAPTGGAVFNVAPSSPFRVYQGIIKQIMPVNKSVMILVEEIPKGQLELVWFHPKENLPIVGADGKPAALADLKVGQRVAIQYFPEFAKTDPPQTTAHRIIIIEGAKPK